MVFATDLQPGDMRTMVVDLAGISRMVSGGRPPNWAWTCN